MVPDQPLDGGDLDSETGNAILIPCNPTFDIPQPHMIPPTDLDRCATRPPLDRLPTVFNDLTETLLQLRVLA